MAPLPPVKVARVVSDGTPPPTTSPQPSAPTPPLSVGMAPATAVPGQKPAPTSPAAGDWAAVSQMPALTPVQTQKRAPVEALKALAKSFTDQIPELRDVDPRLLEMIIPTEDVKANMQYFKCLDGPLSPLAFVAKDALAGVINQRLNLPNDGKPWPVVYRSDKFTVKDPSSGAEVPFIDWQTIHVVDQRANREEARHPYSIVTEPDGTARLSIARRRDNIDNPGEIIDKLPNRYTLTVKQVPDYRKDFVFENFIGRSPRLKALIGDTPADQIKVVSTDMDRPFQITFLEQGGARSHNYYVLNTATGERMHIHFFRFGESTSLLSKPKDLLIHELLPNELGFYQVTDFEKIPRTDVWDPTLTPGLKSSFLPGYAAAYKRVSQLPVADFASVEPTLKRIVTDVKIGDQSFASKPGTMNVGRTERMFQALKLLDSLDAPHWLATIHQLSVIDPDGKPLDSDGGIESLLYNMVTENPGSNGLMRSTLERQMQAKLGVGLGNDLAAFSQVLRLR